MKKQLKFKMKLNNDGLTVGELTITLAALIIIGLIWSSINKKQDSTETSYMSNIESISLTSQYNLAN